MKFKPLLDHWKKEAPPVRTAREYAVRLDLDDASRIIDSLSAPYTIASHEIVIGTSIGVSIARRR